MHTLKSARRFLWLVGWLGLLLAASVGPPAVRPAAPLALARPVESGPGADTSVTGVGPLTGQVDHGASTIAELLAAARSSPAGPSSAKAGQAPSRLPLGPDGPQGLARLGRASQAAANDKPTPTPAPPLDEGPAPTIKYGSGPAGEPAALRPPLAAIGSSPSSPNLLVSQFQEGYEGVFPGSVWTLLDGSNDGFDRRWGKDDVRAQTGTYAAWVAAGGADGVDPATNLYPNNLDSWMIVGPFDLSNAQAADMEFRMWYDTEVNFDWLFVGAATAQYGNYNGLTWTGLSGGWTYYDLDLGAYVGQSNVWVGFVFHSDLSVQAPGVWIDNVAVRKQVTQATDLISNRTFETGSLSPWNNAGTGTAALNGTAHGGAWSARFGGDGASDKLYQSLAIPSSVRMATLDFWIKIDGTEYAPGFDTFCARLYSQLPTGNPINDGGVVNLGCADGLNRTNGWTRAYYEFFGPQLDVIRGQTLYLYFYQQTDPVDPTWVWIDDVTFYVDEVSGDAREPNNSPGQATQILPGGAFTVIDDLSIDPADDWDWFRFQGTAGNSIEALASTTGANSWLDGVMYLLDSNYYVLAFVDDYSGFDPWFRVNLPSTGTYYLVVSSYDGSGGPNHRYDFLAYLHPTPVSTPTSSPSPTATPSPTRPPNAKAWTAIFYFNSDSGLNYEPNIRLLEQQLQSRQAFANFIVLIDPGNPQSPNATRYVLHPSHQYTTGVNRWDMGELNMGDKRTLVDFVQWAMANYPADHYYLSVADHGSGFGLSYDDVPGDHLSADELYSAIKDITGNGATRLGVLQLDACLMSLYEVAYDLRSFASYLIANESVGWMNTTDYWNYFNQLNPSTTPLALAQDIFDKYAGRYTGTPYVVGLVDLSRVQALASAVNGFANALSGALPSQRANIVQARWSAQKFSFGPPIANSDVFVDLWDFADQVSQRVPSLSGSANAVKSAVNSALVQYMARSGNPAPGVFWDHSHAHGMSVFWPQTRAFDYEAYRRGDRFNASRDGTWDEFLENVYNGGSALAAAQLSSARLSSAKVDAPAAIDGRQGLQQFGLLALPIEIGAVPMGVVEIQRGDCNADNRRDAADLSATVIEIFDGDGSVAAQAFDAGFPGYPAGCDANADAAIDAGDLSCISRKIMSGSATCGP